MNKFIKLFIALSISIGICQAQTFATTSNVADGKIVLLLDKCHVDKVKSTYEYAMFYYTKEGLTEDGCWRFDQSYVFGSWEKLGLRRYPISYFSLEKPFSDFKLF